MDNYIAEKGFSPEAQRVLDIYKNKIVERCTVMKYKIPEVSDSLIKYALKYYNREPTYDNLYHDSLMMKFTDGSRCCIEKNHRVLITDEDTGFTFPSSEVKRFIIDIPPEKQRKFDVMVNNAIEFRGKKQFFHYDITQANCQIFAMDFLEANGLLSPEAKAFTYQEDVYSNFDGLDDGKSVINKVVDGVAWLDTLWHGGSLSQSNGLTNVQINKMLADVPNYRGCYSKDQIPKNLRYNDWVVINMEDHNKGSGTHWVCFKMGVPLTYFDAFGISPPMQVLKLADRNLLFNDKQIQDMNSTACGWFCICCILYDHENRFTDTRTHFIRFINQFSNDTTKNDLILKRLLKKLMFPYNPSLMI